MTLDKDFCLTSDGICLSELNADLFDDDNRAIRKEADKNAGDTPVFCKR